MDRRRIEREARRTGRLLPTPLDLDVFAASLSRHLRRPVTIAPGELPAMAPALWLAFRDHDVIAYDGLANPGHRLFHVFHEVGHIVLHHPVLKVGAFLASVRGEAVTGGPCPYPAELQAEAERFAAALEAIAHAAPQVNDEAARAAAILS